MAKNKTTFHDHLILNRYLLGLFGVSSLPELKEKLNLNDGALIGLDSDGQSRFLHQLLSPLLPGIISEDDLRRYDLNIVRHWQKITKQRNHDSGHILEMKYFQYLSLLFTEIYLDSYFNHRNELQTALNAEFAKYQNELGTTAAVSASHTLDDLRRLAFWNATGSGKTLLMHVNLLQYLDYFKGTPDNIILITPNNGLSRQHWQDFQVSGIDAVIFDRNMGNLLDGQVKIIEVTKLGDKDSDKIVAVSAFAGNNLVLVDEGHRGTSDGSMDSAWLKRRNQIIDQGFSFEYSATFGQAVGKFGGKKQNEVFDTYARAVLFDYSYKFFYEDDYGKEHLILNLPKEAEYATEKYFVACILMFYQQLYLYETNKDRLSEWNIEKPLWIFMGQTVNKSSGNNETQAEITEKSDITKIVHYLAFFLNHRSQVESWMADFLSKRAQILDIAHHDIFDCHFAPLAEKFSGNISTLYTDMVKQLFNSDTPQRLKLTHLKKSDGELTLSVGNKPFGVINIGDAAAFFKSVQEQDDFDTANDDFSGGFFDGINLTDSPINLLIGSRKFTEGWSSWRVSTMGLLNLGKKEGSQIIQMFGRGVRLKGRNFSLKRSSSAERRDIYDLHLEKLETLNVFGIKADYMSKFKEYLHEEGVTPSDEMLTLDFPTRFRLPRNGVKLKTLDLKDGYKGNQQHSFKRVLQLQLYEIPKQFADNIKPPHTVLDRYPRVQAMASQKGGIRSDRFKREKHMLNSTLFPLFDWDKIYRELAQYKLRQGWYNLRLDKYRLKDFVENETGWYTLYIPASEMAVNAFADVEKQQEILLDLLKDYTQRFFNVVKAAYEGQYYEMREVNEANNLLGYYRFEFIDSGEGEKQLKRLQQLQQIIASGNLKDKLEMIDIWNGAGDIQAVCFPPHLYYPLMVLNEKFDEERFPVKMQPLVLQEKSEQRFITDLQEAAQKGQLAEWTGGRDLYLLRNADNKRNGLGFALAGNFYPDFLLWLVDRDSGRQWLSLIDPKGIRQMDLGDPKFGLADEVKRLQRELRLDICLNSFILSVTARRDLLNVADWSDEDFRKRHILFMDDDYLPEMFAMILAEGEMS